jgi:hypothetical protein
MSSARRAQVAAIAAHVSHVYAKTCGAISLRRHCPDQVLGIAIRHLCLQASQVTLIG